MPAHAEGAMQVPATPSTSQVGGGDPLLLELELELAVLLLVQHSMSAAPAQ
jgi:hypothetical protein